MVWEILRHYVNDFGTFPLTAMIDDAFSYHLSEFIKLKMYLVVNKKADAQFLRQLNLGATRMIKCNLNCRFKGNF